jgi:hypothetical protein
MTCVATCLAVGVHCTEASDCCTGYCDPYSGTCTNNCTADDFPCSADIECCNGTCSPQTFICHPVPGV